MTFFAIDIGNTRLKWALYASPQPGAPVISQGAVFLENIDSLAESEWHRLATPGSILGCNVAGDAVRRRVEEQLELWDRHHVGSSAVPTPAGSATAMTTRAAWAPTVSWPRLARTTMCLHAARRDPFWW